MMRYTIGFTGQSVERFFTLLRDHGGDRLVDSRLRPGGQRSGFAKGSDLAWLLRQLKRLAGMGIVHLI